MLAFARGLGADGLCDVVKGSELDFPSLHRFSVDRAPEFWAAVWRFAGVIAEPTTGVGEGSAAYWSQVVHGLGRMAPPDPALGPRWFLDARLNFAENLLRYRDDREAIVWWNEAGRQGALTYRALTEAVARVAEALRRQGIRSGDRVVGFLPNIPEAVIAMLAASSLGAVWSSCSPDFGARGVLDRFGQIGPRVLICADGYRYAGKAIDTLERVREIAAAIPNIERIVVVPFLRADPPLDAIPWALRWQEWLEGADAREGTRPSGGRDASRGAPPKKENTPSPSRPRHVAPAPPWPTPALPFLRLPFDHPLYIMYSSGTTGLPKCMVHGAGGTLLQHLKEHIIHGDLTRDDRVFYFTTCGWMMWNWLVSVLAVGATVVLYDGAPFASTPASPGAKDLLWEMAEAERLTVFGTSAKYLALAEKEGLAPGRSRDLSSLRTILSTGSPLSPPSFDYVYRDVRRDVRLSSISGGTDLISCFALGNPVGPVWRGEIQVPGLGMKVEIFDDAGHPLAPGAGPGELVCTLPFPSMPVRFWNDPDGAKYRAAYFERYPGVWRHGDWIEATPHGGFIISGRSDATLNPGGVRIGTAEIYRQVEQLPEISESLVIGQEIGSGRERDVRIVLFVRLRESEVLTESLRQKIRDQIRANTSPHHVPKVIIQVPDIPRTISGKITELAVRDLIHGRPVRNTDALANPASLDYYRDLPELASG
jgi:acetoacetyl-CoA synthetase